MPTSTQPNGNPRQADPVSRREFLKTSAVVSAAALVGGCASAQRREAPGILHAEHKPEKLRIGLIGCGGRGTGATFNCVQSSPNVEVVAMGDLFQDRLDDSRNTLKQLGDACKVTDENCFVGFDAYKGVLGCDIDMVVMAPPPHFRPQHLKAAVEAGKHVFMEKPVAVDPVGVRSIIASGELARQKGLAIVAGTQRRHQPGYVETMKRIHDGAIGDIVAAQCYWNQGGLWEDRAQHNWEQHASGAWSDMEWQCRNWLFLTWLSGDHIVEQHVHNIDVVNWALGATPLKAVGMGGRQARTDPKFGNVYDHFSVEFEYPNGVRVLSMCRQIPGTSPRVSERIVGTRGVSDPAGVIESKRSFTYEAPEGSEQDPYVLEHRDLIVSIRSGQPLNEARRIAESTLCAIMGRMSAYTGRELQWSWIMNASTLDLTPAAYEFGGLPVEPVAIPGETKLV